jgi:hypothetical protein
MRAESIEFYKSQKGNFIPDLHQALTRLDSSLYGADAKAVMGRKALKSLGAAVRAAIHQAEETMRGQLRFPYSVEIGWWDTSTGKLIQSWANIQAHTDLAAGENAWVTEVREMDRKASAIWFAATDRYEQAALADFGVPLSLDGD